MKRATRSNPSPRSRQVHTLLVSALTWAAVTGGVASASPSAPPDPATEAARPPGADTTTIDIWVRADDPLDHTRGGTAARALARTDEAPRARTLRLDLDRLPLVDVQRVDAQYGGIHLFRGLPLQSALERFAPEPTLDLAILHFANGMAIPLPFRDAATMKRLDPFIARGMRTTPTGPMRLAAFPEIAKPNAATAATATAGTKAIDVRPIAFTGNKLVVAEAWHPAMSPAAQSSFSPWAHADTLTSIELVAAEPYYHQFEVGGDASVHQGLAIFRQSCQFCHGARKVGANFGWDFVEPTPIYSYHKPVRNLFYHVAYKPLDAAERGLMMPAMRFMTEADATLLWHWLRAVASRPMPPYMLTYGAHT